MDDLLADFVAETRETLDAIASELVAWEADPADRARLDAIFRFVHTVKGSCGFLDLPRLQHLSHAAEDALAEVRSGKRDADSILVSAVLAIVDRIGELTDALGAGEGMPEGDDSALIGALATHGNAGPVQASGGVGAAPGRVLARSIRLPLELLDRMMAGVSDMVLARNDLARRLRDGGMEHGVEVSFDRLSLCIGEMRDAISRSRMARVDALFAMLPRMARDLAGELGKQVTLEVDGGDVELDREMIEMIRDPLTHIVRNAIDHGIESPEARVRAGKAAAGVLRVTARQSGNQILIEASDDGRGIDDEKLVAKAIASGVVTTDEGLKMSRARRLDLIFAPGLSTASKVTEVSGRGVGMDVVRANIERIGGAVEVDSRKGAGLRLTMRVPLTLTIIPALTVSVGRHSFAIPRSAIDEIVRVGHADVRTEALAEATVAFIRGARLPYVDLGGLLETEARTKAPNRLVVLRIGGGERYALAVDAVHDHEELVVKPAAPELMASGIYAGATLPDNSRPMLLLDVVGIAKLAGIDFRTASAPEEAKADTAAATVPALLFRDLDGRVRAVRLSIAERLEDVGVSALFESDGAMRLIHDGRVLPLVARGPLPTEGRMRVMRLSDGTVQLAYGIAEVVDIVALPTGFDADAITLVDDRPVEILDVFGLFASLDTQPAAVATGGPVCLVADAADPWARQMLAPLLTTAGYRVRFPGDAEADEAAIMVATTAPVPASAGGTPVVRLRAAPERQGPEDDSIYRYDRAGLLDAIRACVGN